MDNVAQHLLRLQLGAAHRPTRRRARTNPASVDAHARVRSLLVRGFSSPDTATFARLNAASGNPTPVFQVAFARASGNARQQQLLAAADEDGVISIVDSSRLSHNSDRRGIFQDVHAKWLAHDNAIFDIAWASDNSTLFTAGGDLRVCCWDVEARARVVALEGGHTMSVKCARQSPDDCNLIATGARDGNILLWDTRAPSKSVAQLLGVHSVSLPSPAKASARGSGSSSTTFVSPVGTNKRRRTAATATSPRSVTSIEFASNSHELISAGAVDSVVKYWDLRRHTAPRKVPIAGRSTTATPVRTLTCSSRPGAQRGITCLALDATRTKLLVSVLNDELSVYHSSGLHADPLYRLEGHCPSSFYVRAAFSPDGDFVTSGSSDGVVYVWDTATSVSDRVYSPVVALKGHTSEANGVAWHTSDFTRLASCSDDGTIRLWTAQRPTEEARDGSDAFTLQRKQQRWQNWPEFDAQADGRAYAVDACEEARDDDDTRSPTRTLPKLDAVISSPDSPADVPTGDAETSTPPLQPQSQPQQQRRYATPTLLDFWSPGRAGTPPS